MRDLHWSGKHDRLAGRSRPGAAIFVVCSLVIASAAAVTVPALSAAASEARQRCSTNPTISARFIVPPAPFKAGVTSVRRRALPAGEPSGGGPMLKRLYLVTFHVTRGNAVLPAGHLRGGSGP